jgi:hypothetical protein
MGGMLLAPKLMSGMAVVGKTLYITWFRHRMIPHKVPETLILTAALKINPSRLSKFHSPVPNSYLLLGYFTFD